MTNFNKERLVTLKSDLLTLCKDYDSVSWAATPIELLVTLMNNRLISLLEQEEEEGGRKAEAKHFHEVSYQVTAIISFLASVHEIVSCIEHIETLK